MAGDTIHAFDTCEPGALALTYYDPPKVFGEATEFSDIWLSPAVYDNVLPLLQLKFYENTGPQPRWRSIYIEVPVGKYWRYHTNDLKVAKLELSAEGKHWARDYGLQLVERGLSGKGKDMKTWKQNIKYRMLTIELAGMRFPENKWFGVAREEMTGDMKEFDYVF